ncbi:MAG TPA: hypothetical protein VGO68_19090 [Pyrinomonadaceae bacterium]|nr:hypothetical protein [Pyrinomonadaceae bacterium]
MRTNIRVNDTSQALSLDPRLTLLDATTCWPSHAAASVRQDT